MEEQYAFYRKANNENKFEENIDLLAWKSCSEPIINDWLSFDKPIYLAYGTNDITSDLCDLIPLFFIREKKENLTYKRYLNLEHNFFEVDNEGSVNHEKPRWKDVMNDFLIWSLK